MQPAPDLFSFLQGVIDDDPTPGRWILSGSRDLSLLESVSQSLAGRTEVHHLLTLTHGEITRFDRHPARLDDTLYFGGYPRIFDLRMTRSRSGPPGGRPQDRSFRSIVVARPRPYATRCFPNATNGDTR